MNRLALASSVASVVLCAASVLLASDTPKPASAKQPVTARTDLMKTMVRVEGTVSWPTSGGSPTATAGATACEQVKVAATKETPSGGMMPKTETLGETTGKPVDAADRSKGCTYALMGLPSGQPLKMSARFTGAWSAPLGGGFVGSTAVTATLQPGTTKQNFALVVNAVK